MTLIAAAAPLQNIAAFCHDNADLLSPCCWLEGKRRLVWAEYRQGGRSKPARPAARRRVDRPSVADLSAPNLTPIDLHDLVARGEGAAWDRIFAVLGDPIKIMRAGARNRLTLSGLLGLAGKIK